MLRSRSWLRSLTVLGVTALIAGPLTRPSSLTLSILLSSFSSRSVSAPLSASLGATPLPAVRPPTVIPGPLDGEPTTRALALRRPVAVVVDNYAPDARPQSGLAAASVVMETLVEGGITRLMAIYLEHDAPMVGPVRSTRDYFDDWAAAFHAILVHVGGNDDAQALLWRLPPVDNLDESAVPFMFGNTMYYWRSRDRQVPDNMYASEEALRRYAAGHQQDWAYSGAALPHKRAASSAQRGGSGTLTVSFVDPLSPFIPADPDYTVRYVFDRGTDTYRRVVGGSRQIDAGSRTEVRAANVVIMETGPATADSAAGLTPGSIQIPVIGSGDAWYFRDGLVERGRWEQRDQFAPLRFLDERGHPVAFDPGQTWIEVLPQHSTARWTLR